MPRSVVGKRYKHKPFNVITIDNVEEARHWVARQRAAGRSVGFVPTMGALHEGHLSLVERSCRENEVTVCSIFVNPIQFNKSEDLEKYPRMPETDIGLLEETRCDMLFMPSEQNMYPEPVTKQYSFGHLDEVMEGAFRPGHFNGVAIVVDRLFRIVQPTRAYFGTKDYQQLLVIREMTRQEEHPTEIIGCPIIREPDGLAMSSRNIRLTQEQRKHAPAIYEALRYAKENFRNYTVPDLENEVRKRFNIIPGAKPEYVTVADTNTLVPLKKWIPNQPAVMCVAVYMGDIRLIDNMILE